MSVRVCYCSYFFSPRLQLITYYDAPNTNTILQKFYSCTLQYKCLNFQLGRQRISPSALFDPGKSLLRHLHSYKPSLFLHFNLYWNFLDLIRERKWPFSSTIAFQLGCIYRLTMYLSISVFRHCRSTYSSFLHVCHYVVFQIFTNSSIISR